MLFFTLRIYDEYYLNYTADSAIEGMNGAEYFFDDVSQKILIPPTIFFVLFELEILIIIINVECYSYTVQK